MTRVEPMRYEEIVSTLGYATGHALVVHLTLGDGTSVTGLPTSVDTHITANEVYLRVAGSEDAEVSVSLAQLARVELA